MSGPNPFEKMMKAKAAMIPKTGYNVVGVDTFEPPGEELYLVGHFESRSEAERVMTEKRKAVEKYGKAADKFYVYGPEDA